MPAKEMPIFTRTFDLLAWLLPMTNHFPRVHRHTVTKRLIDAAFDLRERLEEANLRRRGDRRAAAADFLPLRSGTASCTTRSASGSSHSSNVVSLRTHMPTVSAKARTGH